MSRYTIDKGIPMPKRDRENPKYPFSQMVVGDSFYSEESRGTLMAAAAYYGKKNPGVKFSVRKFDHGFRVWRIA